MQVSDLSLLIHGTPTHFKNTDNSETSEGKKETLHYAFFSVGSTAEIMHNHQHILSSLLCWLSLPLHCLVPLVSSTWLLCIPHAPKKSSAQWAEDVRCAEVYCKLWTQYDDCVSQWSLYICIDVLRSGHTNVADEE